MHVLSPALNGNTFKMMYVTRMIIFYKHCTLNNSVRFCIAHYAVIFPCNAFLSFTALHIITRITMFTLFFTKGNKILRFVLLQLFNTRGGLEILQFAGRWPCTWKKPMKCRQQRVYQATSGRHFTEAWWEWMKAWLPAPPNLPSFRSE